MDRLETMTILLRVVDRGSFSAASRDLGVPLATVSRKVNELEAHLGTKLLVRTTRKVALTDVGSAYVASTRRILDEIDETERIAAGEFHVPRGELILTAPILFGRLHILPIVTEFLAAYPQINVRMLLTDRNLHLIEDHVDMAVRIGPLPDSTMIGTRVGLMRTVVCASPKLLAEQGVPKCCVPYSNQVAEVNRRMRLSIFVRQYRSRRMPSIHLCAASARLAARAPRLATLPRRQAA